MARKQEGSDSGLHFNRLHPRPPRCEYFTRENTMSVPGGPMTIGPVYIGPQPTPLPASVIGGNYVHLPSGWKMPSSTSEFGQGLKDLIINQSNISNHEVIASISRITQTEKTSLETIIEQQKKLTDEDAQLAKQRLAEMAKNAPLEYRLYSVFTAQMEKKKALLKRDSQKKILAFIESTKEWNFLQNPSRYPYRTTATFPGPGGSKFTLEKVINTVAQRDALLKDNYTQKPSAELVASFVNQFNLSVRNVLLYIRGQHAEVSQEIAATRAEIRKLEALVIAAEKARTAAQAQALNAAHTFRLPAASKTQLSAAGGVITISAGSRITLEAAIQAAIRALKVAAGTAISVTSAAGIGLLTYSPSLGNGELPVTLLNLPAKDLAPDLPENLLGVAAAGGTVDMPYRILGDPSKYSVVATQITAGVSAQVPVRALSFDPVADAYTYVSTDTPPITLTFPIATPGNSSTATPTQPAKGPTYTGITLTPTGGRADSFPAIPVDFRDAIYVYPVDAGLPAIYAVFSSPYEGATTRGVHSGRLYNPDKAGGPIQQLDWRTTSVTRKGIDLVKLHTGRFGPSDANAVMIGRLEQILGGKVFMTDTDKRFYTHELRELERYRVLGVADGAQPDDDSIWNNTHSATLEDFKLVDNFNLLYTPEAVEADNAQVERQNK